MPRVGFEPTIPAGERPKTYALDRAATETGSRNVLWKQNRRKDQQSIIGKHKVN